MLLRIIILKFTNKRRGKMKWVNFRKINLGIF